MTILWVFLIFVLLLSIYNLWFVKRGLSRLEYQRTFSDSNAFVGDNITMVEVISNSKLLPIPLLTIESRMPKILSFEKLDDLTISADMYHKSIFFMGAYKKVTRTHYVSCVKRGRFELSSVSISAGSLLGLSNIIMEKSLSAKISIYPKLLSYNEIPKLSKQLLGDIIVKRWISPDPFLINGIRQYVRGDNLKDIHWAATAKTGDLKVKTHDFSASPNLLVLLNIEASENQWGILLEHEAKPIEYGISLASTILLWAMENGLKAGFGTNGYLCGDEDKKPVYVNQDGGAGGMRNILETMSRIEVSRSLTFYTYLDTLIKEKIRDIDILVLSTHMNARIGEQIKKMKLYGNSVTIQIIKD